jgi:hypothetical protein
MAHTLERAQAAAMTRFRRLAVGLVAITIGVAGCGGDEAATTATTASEQILINLDLDRPNGGVLSGSRIGDAAFCRGGTTVSRHADHATVTTLRCEDGELTIAFPSSDGSREQRSCWHVLDASGRFAGLAGHGEMKARSGRATFAGTVVEARRGAENLDRFLMRKGEEPGFRPGAAPGASPQSGETITGVDAFVQEMGLAPADAERLRGEGFISFTVAPIRGPQAAGVTNVSLHQTAEGAQRSLAYELRPEVIRSFGPIENLRFFKVPGVPGARGWTASEPHVGNVHWVQGRCMLVLGNQGPGPFVGPLSTGARSIFERTNGECP